MRKTSIILIKNNMKELYVSKYMLRKTKNGQYVMDLIKYMGNLHTLEKLNTEEAYLAIEDLSYYSEEEDTLVSYQLGEKFAEMAQTITVVVTLKDKDKLKFKPYRLHIFGNNISLKKGISEEEIEKYGLTLTYKEKDETEKFEFITSRRTKIVDLEQVLEEKDEYLANLSNVIWLDKYNYCKKAHIHIFSKKWAEEMRSKLDQIEDENIAIYPSLTGQWLTTPIGERPNRNFPYYLYEKTCKGNPNKKFWKKYLKNFRERKVIFNTRFNEGKIID